MQNKIYLTPGPSQLYFTVPDHLKSALKEDIMSISHRSGAFQKIFQETRQNLKDLLELPEGYDIYFISSANEIWERIIQNLVERKSHHFVNGSFAKKFYQFALDYQRESTITQVEDGAPFKDLAVPDDSELISVTLNETSIGYGFPLNDLYALREKHPEKLLAVDGVSAFPAIKFDFSKVDSAYFSVQKCFGLPAGLGVWIVNQRCYDIADNLQKKGVVTGSYHQILQLKEQGDTHQTPETPNVLGIYLLGKVTKDMLFRKVRQIQNDTTYKSTVLYQAIEQSSKLKPFITAAENRSKTVIVAEMIQESADLISSLANNGWIVGKGYGKYKNKHLRIANFPVHSKEQMEQVADFLQGY